MRSPLWLASLFGFGLAALFSPAQAGAADPDPQMLTIADCYRLALQRSEEIAVRQELITETEGRFLKSLSAVLPKLSFSSVDKRQDGSGDSAFTRRSLPERKFTFSQPLFSGFKEFAAMEGSKSEKRLRQQEKRRAEQLLLVDVSDAFHLLLEQREDLQVLDSIRQTLRERIQELEGRERIGRSRPSELVAARAQLYRVEAEWEEGQTREQIASQLLQFLTGLAPIGDLADPGAALPALPPQENLVAGADLRPDVQAAEISSEIARQEFRVARAKFYPTVTTEGNYFVERSGAAKEVAWDASLKVDVPIFQGGSALGAAKEAESRLRQARIRIEQARRQTAQEIRDAHSEYDGALARVRALTKALEAQEENYQLQVEEYRRSLVSNLEVLRTLGELQDARRDLIAALYQAHRLYWKLRVAAGETIP